MRGYSVRFLPVGELNTPPVHSRCDKFDHTVSIGAGVEGALQRNVTIYTHISLRRTHNS